MLLGEPGAGKSIVFEQEAKAIGPGARYVTARSLLTLGPPDGWTNEILFIDALAERRGDSSAFLSSLDELRQKLKQLGRPRFRLSASLSVSRKPLEKEELQRKQCETELATLVEKSESSTPQARGL